MGQTSEGARRAAIMAKKLHGENWHSKIGKIGGKKSKAGGFAVLPEKKHKAISKKGGHNKKGYKKPK